MTLTQLAKKHNLEPESAKAFLREWLDMQPYAAMLYRDKMSPYACSLLNTKIAQNSEGSKPFGEWQAAEINQYNRWKGVGSWMRVTEAIPLIARHTDLGD